MMLIGSGILLKNMLVVIYSKYYMTVLSRQFAKTWNQIFYLSRANENLETCMLVRFEHLKELKQFWGTFTGQYFINGHYSKNAKYIPWKLLYVAI